MFIGILSWWYGNGWVDQWRRLGRRIVRVEQHFSMGDLAMSLFAPFRQVSAAGNGGPINLQLRGWIDRQVSRFVGFFLRTIVLFVGALAVLFVTLFGVVLVGIGWAVVPLLPLVGVWFAVNGFAT